MKHYNTKKPVSLSRELLLRKRGIIVTGKLVSLLLRMVRRTWEVRSRGRENIDQLYNDQEKRFLVCFWHGKYVAFPSLLEGYNACIVSSLSRRGAVIAEICKNFGYSSVLIPEKASRNFLKNVEKPMAGCRIIATPVDGPLGPYHRVKYGLIKLAAELNLELLPVSLASRQKIVLTKRWDRLEIPLPFTTVGLVFGEPQKVSEEPHAAFLHRKATALGIMLEDLDRQAEKLVE